MFVAGHMADMRAANGGRRFQKRVAGIARRLDMAPADHGDVAARVGDWRQTMDVRRVSLAAKPAARAEAVADGSLDGDKSLAFCKL